jgi:hypothetical protein
LIINIPRVVWTEISKPVRRNAVVEQELSFEALLDSSLGRGLQIVLVNGTSAYNPGTSISGS